MAGTSATSGVTWSRALPPLRGRKRPGSLVCSLLPGLPRSSVLLLGAGSLELWAQLWPEGPASWVPPPLPPACCGCGCRCGCEVHVLCATSVAATGWRYGLGCCACGGARVPALPLSLALPPLPGVVLPEELHGQRSLVGCGPWSHRVGRDWVTNIASSVCSSSPAFGYTDVWVSPACWWDEHRKLRGGVNVVLKQEKQRELFTTPWCWCLPSKPLRVCVCGYVCVCVVMCVCVYLFCFFWILPQ